MPFFVQASMYEYELMYFVEGSPHHPCTMSHHIFMSASLEDDSNTELVAERFQTIVDDYQPRQSVPCEARFMYKPYRNFNFMIHITLCLPPSALGEWSTWHCIGRMLRSASLSLDNALRSGKSDGSVVCRQSPAQPLVRQWTWFLHAIVYRCIVVTNVADLLLH